ncbi:MAG: hypothetical protein V6Z89_17910 [Desulfobacter sp.]
MSPPLLKILGLIIIGMGVWGLFTGRVMAGSRGLQPNYYTRHDQPVLYYVFICVYLVIGAVVFFR